MKPVHDSDSGVSRHFRIRGRVQGVGFRWFVQDVARALELRGWVRNLSDGSVEVTAHGDPEKIEALAQRLAQGPASSRVESVEESAGIAPGVGPFEIR